MRLSIIEPLGITEEQVQSLAKKYLPDDVELTYYNTQAGDDAEKKARVQGADVLMLANSPLPQSVLETATAAKFISMAFTGVDHVAMDYCHEKGLVVSNCSGYANEAVSELAIGMVIGLYRKLAECDAAVRSGKTRAGLLGRELCGKKFGIVGAGAIGLATAKLAQAFGCEVYAYSRTKKEVSGVTFLSLDELLQTVDIVSLHVPLTPATRGMIGIKELALMKETAILINTARGPVVDGAALAAALSAGRIAGAGIDVFDGEPPIPEDNPLLSAPHVLLAPHIGFATQEALEKRAVIAFENVAKWIHGQPQNVM